MKGIVITAVVLVLIAIAAFVWNKPFYPQAKGIKDSIDKATSYKVALAMDTSKMPIEGIGVFKVGKMPITDVLRDRSKLVYLNKPLLGGIPELEYMYKDASHQARLLVQKYSANKVVEIGLNTTLKKHKCADVREFVLPSRMESGIKLYNIHLSFYKDTLFNVSCAAYFQLEEAFKAKYGEPHTICNDLICDEDWGAYNAVRAVYSIRDRNFEVYLPSYNDEVYSCDGKLRDVEDKIQHKKDLVKFKNL